MALTFAALAALALFVAVLLGGTARGAEPPPAVPDTLASYVDELSVDARGDAEVRVTAVVGRVSSTDLLLPWGLEGGRDHRVMSGPAELGRDADGRPQPLVDVLGAPHWNARLRADAAPGDTVVLAATVPGWQDLARSRRQFGTRAYGRAWVNTSRFVLREARLELVLPEGQVVESVGATTPSFDPNDSPQPPFTIGRRAGRGVLAVAAAAVSPADRLAFQLQARPRRRGPAPLVAGVVVAALYLVFFRDLVRTRRMDVNQGEGT